MLSRLVPGRRASPRKPPPCAGPSAWHGDGNAGTLVKFRFHVLLVRAEMRRNLDGPPLACEAEASAAKELLKRSDIRALRPIIDRESAIAFFELTGWTALRCGEVRYSDGCAVSS